MYAHETSLFSISVYASSKVCKFFVFMPLDVSVSFVSLILSNVVVTPIVSEFSLFIPSFWNSSFDVSIAWMNFWSFDPPAYANLT